MKKRIYLKPSNLDEAAAVLARHDRAVIVGGGAYLRLRARRFDVAVDLYDAGLDYVRESDAGLEIGAMATFRMLETDPRVRGYADGVISRSVERIMGVQVRNIITVGGTVYGRYPFSNLITTLLALGADVVLHRAGRMGLEDFLAGKPDPKDILAAVVLPNCGARAAWRELVRTRNDFAVLNAAVVLRDGVFTVAVGARPGLARRCPEASAALAAGGGDAARRAGEAAAAELEFGDDVRASASYRHRICGTLVARAAAEVLS